MILIIYWSGCPFSSKYAIIPVIPEVITTPQNTSKLEIIFVTERRGKFEHNNPIVVLAD